MSEKIDICKLDEDQQEEFLESITETVILERYEEMYVEDNFELDDIIMVIMLDSLPIAEIGYLDDDVHFTFFPEKTSFFKNCSRGADEELLNLVQKLFSESSLFCSCTLLKKHLSYL